MNCSCDLTGWRLDASDVTLRLERARHLDTEVDVHCLIATFRVVIEEQIVSRAQLAIGFQERSHLIGAPASMLAQYTNQRHQHIAVENFRAPFEQVE